MKEELRERIYAYNKKVAEKNDKAADLDILVAKINGSPLFSQLKSLLPDEVLAVLEKHGSTE